MKYCTKCSALHPIKGLNLGDLPLCTCVTSLSPGTSPEGQDVTQICVVCGSLLEGYSNKRTCSPKCRVALHRKEKREKNNQS